MCIYCRTYFLCFVWKCFPENNKKQQQTKKKFIQISMKSKFYQIALCLLVKHQSAFEQGSHLETGWSLRSRMFTFSSPTVVKKYSHCCSCSYPVNLKVVAQFYHGTSRGLESHEDHTKLKYSWSTASTDAFHTVNNSPKIPTYHFIFAQIFMTDIKKHIFAGANECSFSFLKKLSQTWCNCCCMSKNQS